MPTHMPTFPNGHPGTKMPIDVPKRATMHQNACQCVQTGTKMSARCPNMGSKMPVRMPKACPNGRPETKMPVHVPKWETHTKKPTRLYTQNTSGQQHSKIPTCTWAPKCLPKCPPTCLNSCPGIKMIEEIN